MTARAPVTDWSEVVEGLIATGMRQSAIARRLHVSESTVLRWRLGMFEPRVRLADALLDLAETHTASEMQKFHKRKPRCGT